jgi:hypothetical protein
MIASERLDSTLSVCHGQVRCLSVRLRLPTTVALRLRLLLLGSDLYAMEYGGHGASAQVSLAILYHWHLKCVTLHVVLLVTRVCTVAIHCSYHRERSCRGRAL